MGILCKYCSGYFTKSISLKIIRSKVWGRQFYIKRHLRDRKKKKELWLLERKNSNEKVLENIEGFKMLVQDLTADVVATAREVELEVEPGDVAEPLQSHDTNFSG